MNFCGVGNLTPPLETFLVDFFRLESDYDPKLWSIFVTPGLSFLFVQFRHLFLCPKITYDRKVICFEDLL